MSVDDFSRRNKPSRNRSKLGTHENEIRELREKGYSWQQVADYLQEIGLLRHPNTVSQWWDRKNKEKTPQGSSENKLVRGNGSPRNNVLGCQGTERGSDESKPGKTDPGSALDELLGECSEPVPGLKIPRSRNRG